MDTTFVETTITTTSTLTNIVQAITPVGWVCLFLGWLMYWLKKLDDARLSNKGQPIKYYLTIWGQDNWIEIPSSAISCLVLALLGTEIPTSLLDMRGLVSLFLVGYANSSILNKVITRIKPQQ